MLSQDVLTLNLFKCWYDPNQRRQTKFLTFCEPDLEVIFLIQNVNFKFEFYEVVILMKLKTTYELSKVLFYLSFFHKVVLDFSLLLRGETRPSNLTDYR